MLNKMNKKSNDIVTKLSYKMYIHLYFINNHCNSLYYI